MGMVANMAVEPKMMAVGASVEASLEMVALLGLVAVWVMVLLAVN